MSSIFKDQIFKRKQEEDIALRDAMQSAIEETGLYDGKNRRNTTRKSHIELLLDALNINYEFEEKESELGEQQFRDIVEANGIMMRRMVLNDKWWKETTGPIMGHDKKGNIIALIPSRLGFRYYYFDDNNTKTKVCAKTMQDVLDTDAICFIKPLSPEVNSLRGLLWHAIKETPKTDIVTLVISSIIVLLFGMFVPFATKQIFDHIIPSGIYDGLNTIAALLICAAIGTVLFQLTRSLIILRLKGHLEYNMQNAVMARLFMLRPDFFWTHSSGSLNMRVDSISQMCNFLDDTIIEALITAVFSLGYLIQVYIYAKELFPMALLTIVLEIACIIGLFILGSKLQYKYLSSQSELNGLEYDIFVGVQKIKVTGSERRTFARWLKQYASTARTHYNSYTLIAILQGTLQCVSQACFIAFFYFTIKKNIITSDYIAFASAFGLINGALLALSQMTMQLTQIGPLFKMVKPIIETSPEIFPDMQKLNKLNGNIEISNLSFRYSPEMPLVLDNINISIKSGEYVGIVGKSGCGKSTLLRLLLGFEKPLSGGIFYDQHDLQKVDKASLRRCIGCCLQNGSLFIGEILNNITITAPWSTQEDAWEALRMASMEKEVRALPMGLHTIISEGGGGFSGGQKQRLLIARALISKPSIIFFDEATSALDNVTQKEVTDNLDTLHCTRVVIAHRLSTIRNCDRIIVMDGGHIVEEGTFDELMELHGLFYEMSKRQL